MIVAIMRIKIYLPWSQSLKNKRAAVRSISSKIRNKFNTSIAEVDAQNIPKTIVLGIAFTTSEKRLAEKIADEILYLIENNVEGEVVECEREIEVF